ncbi:hypothetical protein ACOSP7_026871 [Xanthoceras sorbifolium]
MTSFEGVLSPAAAEAKAICFGLLMAFEGGMAKFSLNSDAANVIRFLDEDAVSLSEVGLLIEDIKDLVRRFNGDVSSAYSPRSTNWVAHSPAKLALDNICNVFWMQDSHPSIRNLIVEESCVSV